MQDFKILSTWQPRKDFPLKSWTYLDFDIDDEI